MKYRTIVADPPWDHSDGTGVKLDIGYGSNRRPLPEWVDPISTAPPYPVLTLSEISNLPVGDLAERDAHLYLWTTNRYLRHVWGIAETWGFTPSCVLTWCKRSPGFRPGGTFPSDTEFCLFARRGSLAAKERANGRWFQWPRRLGPPVKEGEHRNTMHSAKPEAFLDLVEQISPGPYIELFARRQRLGWDTWGNEALDHIGAERMTPTKCDAHMRSRPDVNTTEAVDLALYVAGWMPDYRRGVTLNKGDELTLSQVREMALYAVGLQQ